MINKELLTSDNAWKDENIYNEIYDYSIENPNEYWKAQLDRLDWITKPTIIRIKPIDPIDTKSSIS